MGVGRQKSAKCQEFEASDETNCEVGKFLVFGQSGGWRLKARAETTPTRRTPTWGRRGPLKACRGRCVNSRAEDSQFKSLLAGVSANALL